MKTPQPSSLTQDWSGHTLDMMGALILVLGAVFVVSLILRYLQRRTGANTGHLRILQVLSVGAKDRVLLVQVGVDQILMGVSTAGIQHLHTLTEPVEVLEDQTNKPAASFEKTITSLTGKQQS